MLINSNVANKALQTSTLKIVFDVNYSACDYRKLRIELDTQIMISAIVPGQIYLVESGF